MYVETIFCENMGPIEKAVIKAGFTPEGRRALLQKGTPNQLFLSEKMVQASRSCCQTLLMHCMR